MKIRCDCVDVNGNVWPDCTCNHGWRTVSAVLTLETELTAARAEIERLRDTLRQVQWGNCNWIPYADDVAGFTVSMCPMCDQTEDRGHAPDCLVGMLLEPNRDAEQ